MLPFLIPMLIGAGVGAVTNRDNPLKGALIGGTLGAFTGGLGGAAAGGAGGAGSGLLGGAAGGVEAGAAGGLGAGAAGGLGAGSQVGWGGATTGLQGGLNSALGSGAGSQVGGLLGNASTGLETANKFATPISKGMEAAQMFQKEDRPPEIPLPAPLMSPPQYGPQSLTQLAGQNEQYNMTQAMQDYQERQKRKQRIGMMSSGLL